MKQIFLIVTLMLQTVAFAFDKNSALDFVYEYSADSLWGIKMPYGYDYKVGMIEHDIDTLYNSRNIYDGMDSVGTRIDTIIVPKNNYVFFATTPDNFVIKGQSPFLSYFFLSKTDSSFSVIDTFGHPERFCCWDAIREDGRFLRKEAIIDAPRIVEGLLGEIDYDLYIVDDSVNVGVYANSGNTANLYNDYEWCFIVDIKKDTCYLFSYLREKEPGGIVCAPALTIPIICNTDLSATKELTLVYSRQNGDVRSITSEKKYNVFPNPVTKDVNVDIDDCTLSLYSNDGKWIKSVAQPNMNMSDLPTGMYFLKVTHNGQSQVTRVIKE